MIDELTLFINEKVVFFAVGRFLYDKDKPTKISCTKIYKVFGKFIIHLSDGRRLEYGGRDIKYALTYK